MYTVTEVRRFRGLEGPEGMVTEEDNGEDGSEETRRGETHDQGNSDDRRDSYCGNNLREAQFNQDKRTSLGLTIGVTGVDPWIFQSPSSLLPFSPTFHIRVNHP